MEWFPEANEYSPRLLARIIDAVRVLRGRPNADLTIGYARGIRDTMPVRSKVYAAGAQRGYELGYEKGKSDGRNGQ